MAKKTAYDPSDAEKEAEVETFYVNALRDVSFSVCLARK
jgi:hypothetical protein